MDIDLERLKAYHHLQFILKLIHERNELKDEVLRLRESLIERVIDAEHYPQ